MKKFLIIFLFFLSVVTVEAGSINAPLYKTMQAQSYRNNYNQQINNAPMPYWQAQSNYMTRNRVYTDYQSYTRYNNAVNQYNYNTRTMRYRR